jgi:hypothetical protein
LFVPVAHAGAIYGYGKGSLCRAAILTDQQVVKDHDEEVAMGAVAEGGALHLQQRLVGLVVAVANTTNGKKGRR